MKRTPHVELPPGVLMKVIGSPAGSDPMPVEHHEFWMKHPELINAAVVELMSLIYSKTIRKGHRSPVAVDGAGKLFTIEHVAADRGWTLDWAMRVFNEAVRRGLLRRGKGGKNDFSPAGIVLIGKPKPQTDQVDSGPNTLGASECTLRKLRTLLSETEWAQFERMGEEEKAKFTEVELAEAEIDERIKTDAMFVARETINQRHRIRLLEHGIQPDAPMPKRRDKPPIIQLRIIFGGEVLERSVHSVEREGTYTPANGTEHSGVSIFTLPSGSFPSEESSSSSRRSVEDSSMREEAGRQANACVPALAGLREQFPEPITDQSLIQLDADLTERYPALYFAGEFVKAVGKRQERKPAIRYGLLLKFDSGLFVDEYFQDEKRKLEGRIASIQVQSVQAAEDTAQYERDQSEREQAEQAFAALPVADQQARIAAAIKRLTREHPEYKERWTPQNWQDNGRIAATAELRAELTGERRAYAGSA